MDIIQLLVKEMDAEAQTTRKMLSRVPEGKWDWKPHEKSMSMYSLTVHIAELPSWVTLALTTTELDFAAAPYKPTPVSSREELLAIFEKSLANGRASLTKAKEADLLPNWTLRQGDQI